MDLLYPVSLEHQCPIILKTPPFNDFSEITCYYYNAILRARAAIIAAINLHYRHQVIGLQKERATQTREVLGREVHNAPRCRPP
jgi:hypothetical protein